MEWPGRSSREATDMRGRPSFLRLRLAAAGLLVVAAASRLSADDGLPDSRQGIRTAPILLLTRADVRAELRLSAEQAADAERTIADLHEKAQALKGRTDTEAVAARGEVEDACRLWIERALTPPQRDRLTQLDYQWEGPSAVITRAKVAESLALTDAQRVVLAKAVAERNGHRGGGPPIEADEAGLARVVNEQFTEGQDQRWRSIIGPPFRFKSTARAASAGNAAR
jgi:hypothetical protein